jgi:hypothetical protein
MNDDSWSNFGVFLVGFGVGGIVVMFLFLSHILGA